MIPQLKVAIIGSGYMAREYAKAIRFVPDLVLQGVCSRNLDNAQKFASDFGLNIAVNSVPELFALTKIDVVIICVSETSTASVLDLFAESPVLILVEKPVGLDIATSERFAQDPNFNNRTFVALNRRFYSATLAVAGELRQTEGIREISIVDQVDKQSALNNGSSNIVVEKWMFANSIHLIDYITMFARGKIVNIGKKKVLVGNDAYILKADIEFDSGDFVTYSAYWNLPAKWSVEINTLNTQWQMKPLEIARRLLMSERNYLEISGNSEDQDAKPGLILMLREILKQVSGEPNDLITLSENLQTMKLTGMIYDEE